MEVLGDNRRRPLALCLLVFLLTRDRCVLGEPGVECISFQAISAHLTYLLLLSEMANRG